VLVDTYGEHAPSIRTCETWFRQFKSVDFDVNDGARSERPPKCEDEELQALLYQDPTQTQQQLAKALNVSQVTVSSCRRLKAMGKVSKLGQWVPHDLYGRQMENRKVTCEMLFQRHKRKSFLHRIVTGDENWIYILKSRSGKIVVITWRSRSFNSKARSLRQDDHALCLVESDWYCLL